VDIIGISPQPLSKQKSTCQWLWLNLLLFKYNVRVLIYLHQRRLHFYLYLVFTITSAQSEPLTFCQSTDLSTKTSSSFLFVSGIHHHFRAKWALNFLSCTNKVSILTYRQASFILFQLKILICYILNSISYQGSLKIRNNLETKVELFCLNKQLHFYSLINVCNFAIANSSS
jgi:hypothetical protein